MLDYTKQLIASQFDAALAMLGQCIDRCPAEHWNGKIAKYEFWHVAYHTLCCTESYLAPKWKLFTPNQFHPNGTAELLDEYPSRELSPNELTAYSDHCRRRVQESLAAETAQSLQAAVEFDWLPDFSMGELYLYNMRHVMHHTGQLSAYLRRVGVDTSWAKVGADTLQQNVQ